ncbi:MAG: hypothetical protein ACXACX_10255 [Candidatus Hodarchaeales archaeon]
MSNFRKYWKKKEALLPERNNEEYGFSKGCCFFHDEEELKRFNDIDDDKELKESNDTDDEEELGDYF